MLIRIIDAGNRTLEQGRSRRQQRLELVLLAALPARALSG
jgi:hypothetical protein